MFEYLTNVACIGGIITAELGYNVMKGPDTSSRYKQVLF
jgi:hypothetical protein